MNKILNSPINLKQILLDIEINYIVNAIEQTGSIKGAAELLGIKRTTLSMRARYLGITIKQDTRVTVNYKDPRIEEIFPPNPNNIEDTL